jgi:malic enzyme
MSVIVQPSASCVRVVVTGAGAAGTACTDILLGAEAAVWSVARRELPGYVG